MPRQSGSGRRTWPSPGTDSTDLAAVRLHNAPRDRQPNPVLRRRRWGMPTGGKCLKQPRALRQMPGPWS